MINGTRIAGPALAALLAALGFSLAQLFIVNAVTYLFLIVPLAFSVRLPMPTGALPERGWRKLGSGLRIVRRRGVLLRTLSTMFLFSLLCLPYVGLFPSVARLNFGLDPEGGSYKLLYIVWGLGAFLGALAVGTWLARRDTRRLIPLGMLLFAAALGTFALLDNWILALPVAGALGFVYFMTATALASVMQRNLADTERSATMPLWFMAFGGTVPVGNVVFGPLMDAIGARWVLAIGAASALVLAWWSDLKRLDEGDFLPEDVGGEPFRPVNANRLF